MSIVHSVPFSFEGTDYQIAVSHEGGQYVIRAYKKNDATPANGFEYRVSWPINSDMKHTFGITGVQHLIHTAKQDIEAKRWEEYVKAVRKHEEDERRKAAGAPTD